MTVSRETNELVCRKCTRSATIQGDLDDARKLGWITEQWTDGLKFICPKCADPKVHGLFDRIRENRRIAISAPAS